MSGLDKQVVGVDLVQGLETRQDARLVIPGKLLDVQNLTLSDDGALQRRDGWEHINAAAASALNGLGTFNSEVLAVKGSTLYTLAEGNSTLYSRGAISPLTLTKETVYRNAAIQQDADCATDGTYTCYVWHQTDASSATSGGLYYMIKEEATGAVIVAANEGISSSATAKGPRVVYSPATTGGSDANSFIIVWVDGASIQAMAISTATFVNVGGGTIATTNYGTALAAGFIDVLAGDGQALVVWVSSSATNSIILTPIYASTGPPGNIAQYSDVVVSTKAALDQGNAGGLSIAAFSTASTYGIYTAGGAGIWGATYNGSTRTITHAIANFDATVPTAGGYCKVTATAVGANLTVFYDNIFAFSGTGQSAVRSVVISAANAVVTPAATLINGNLSISGAPQGPFIAGKAFTASGVAYLPVFVGGVVATKLNAQDTWFLLDSAGNIAAKALYGSFGSIPMFDGGATLPYPTVRTPPSVLSVNGAFIVPVPEKGPASFTQNATTGALTLTTITTPVGLSRLVLTFNGSIPPIRAQVGQNAFFAGGFLAAYDGALATEAGFHLFPEGITVADGAAGSVTVGPHAYCAVYEWIDAQGQRHQSSPGVAVTYAAPGAKKATVVIPTLLMTAKPNVNIAVYRTAASGTTFFRLNGQASPLANTTSAATVTYTDDTADASLTGEELYTDGGTLDSRGPPSCSALTAHQGRLFICGLEDPAEFRYSQVQVSGYGLQWNPTLSGRVDAVAGAVEALKSMDEKLAVLCARKPYVIFGNGPTAAGLSNGYQLDEVTSDVGCSEARSVLKMPTGIIFKSEKGWHLFDRGLQVKYIGAGVEAFNDNDVCAAILLEDRKEARFYSLTGTTLVYSYLSAGPDGVGQWERNTGQAAVDAVWSPLLGSVVWATAAGALNQDTPGEYGDNGAPIATLIDTGWLKPGASLHGFERVYRLLLAGPYFSSGSLSLTAFYDYDEGTGESITFFGPTGAGFVTGESDDVTVSPTSALAGAGGNTWELRWRLPRQKCQAVRFRISETPSGGTLAGLGFSSISLEVGIKRGAYKLPAARSA